MTPKKYMAMLQKAFRETPMTDIVSQAKTSLERFVDGFELSDEAKNSGLDEYKPFQIAYGIGIVGARTGIACKTGQLTEKQLFLTDSVFGEILPDGMDDLYKLLTSPTADIERDLVFLAIAGTGGFVFELLKLILAFAYVDGEMDESTTERLVSFFETVLLRECEQL